MTPPPTVRSARRGVVCQRLSCAAQGRQDQRARPRVRTSKTTTKQLKNNTTTYLLPQSVLSRLVTHCTLHLVLVGSLLALAGLLRRRLSTWRRCSGQPSASPSPRSASSRSTTPCSRTPDAVLSVP